MTPSEREMNLLKRTAKADELLREFYGAGNEILGLPMETEGDWRLVMIRGEHWVRDVKDFIADYYGAVEGKSFIGSLPSIYAYDNPYSKAIGKRNQIAAGQIHLRALVGRKLKVVLAPTALASASVSGETMPPPITDDNRKVFIVQGRDEGTRDAVVLLLTRLRFEPVVLSEQVKGGRTEIDQIERQTNVPYAVVLLTGDDWGYLDGHDSRKQRRARQNVILELGYLWAKLTRERVCILSREDQHIERPSDADGVLRISLADGSWKSELAHELSEIGWTVDFSKTR